MRHDQFWNLFAKNLAGEASESELEELTLLLKANPGLSYAAQNVADIWKLAKPDQLKEAEKAYNVHLSRMRRKRLISSFSQMEVKPARHQISRKKWPRLLGLFFLVAILVLLGFVLTAEGKNSGNNRQPILQGECLNHPANKMLMIN